MAIALGLMSKKKRLPEAKRSTDDVFRPILGCGCVGLCEEALLIVGSGTLFGARWTGRPKVGGRSAGPHNREHTLGLMLAVMFSSAS